ncbi:unnamed protein product [Cylindrotheca closterium]|uniref:ATP-dependent transporter ycf16 n=1 Tax=Cylindrotheca closterium TaxID=2856 RepID=A0AAD2FUV9_9STRA|nr:unnamed protein product [Cylindrotheca closterium]
MMKDSNGIQDETSSPASAAQHESPTKSPDSPDSPKSPHPPNLFGKASPLAKLLFSWPFSLLKIGLERPLTELDLPEILQVDSSKYQRNYVEDLWEKEKERCPEQPSLRRALLIDYFKSTWKAQPLLCLQFTSTVVQAVALGNLIESFETGNGEGYVWASVLVASGLIVLLDLHQVFFIVWRKGMQVRISCVGAIYAKSLRLPSTHKDTNANTGRIMNLASNDVDRFLLAALFINYLIWAPLQSIGILVVGWWIMGPAFAAGFALLLFVFMPFQVYLSNKFAFFRSKIAAITDRRVTFVSQAVHGARIMKMSGFEWRFLERIQDIRKEEVDQIQKANRLKAANEALFFATNVVIAMAIFLVHVLLLDGTLYPRDIFTVFTLVNILQLQMTKHVSLGIMGASEAYVSIGRIQEFLESPEQHFTESTHDTLQNEQIAISMEDVCCQWNHVRDISTKKVTDDDDDDEISTASLAAALTDITIDFEKGQLTCIIGTVGSGKSALLQAIVGELPVFTGKLQRSYDKLAYAAQDPWIMDGTVQDNITMGSPFRREWYDQVIDACGLRLDFSQFANGDQTVVGDRGVQCSGGQRARIGLARALYRDADVLVADDPLSAVDAKVGRQLFNKAIMELSVKRGKCVILTTHQHQYVHEQRCVLVTKGKIGKIGSYAECVATAGGKLTAHSADDAVDSLSTDPKTASFKAGGKNEVDEIAPSTSVKVNESKEDSNTGVVKFETFLNYARAMGGLGIGIGLFILFTITQAVVLLAVVMMGRWAERTPEDQKSWDILSIVIAMGVAVILLASIRAVVSFYYTIKASRTLHDGMTKAVLRAPISFFDTNPLGRVLNRFSADVGSNDDMLPQTLLDFTVIFFMVMGTLVITVTVLPFTLLAMPVLFYYFWSVRKVFVTSTRELKRLEGLARSPMFAMLSESLSGVATIRANDSSAHFVKKFEFAHDAHTRSFFSFIAASRWVGFRMDSIMFILASVVSVLAVLFERQEWFEVDPAILGLSISMLLQLSGLFQWCIRQSAEVVNQMVSVERVLAFKNLEPEAPLEMDSDRNLDAAWPHQGKIEVSDVGIRYRKGLPLALNGASFSIPAGARVGIVGRTGSGKSTVVQTLFRLLEAENGSITIDGADISKVGLHRLRTKISVIPQMPTLFSGCTIRENLDLFGIHDEKAIVKALEDSHLSDAIEQLPEGYDTLVAEGGSNFSVGQRQLLCLARAILSKNKILILDEATAAVDRRTDQLLHESLHESFEDSTIIAVAHRLDTIIDHDYVLVLGLGKVLEFGPPAELIRSGGSFSQMVEETGDRMSANLKQRAFAKESEIANA